MGFVWSRSTSDQVRGALWDLVHNHFDDDACVDALHAIQTLLQDTRVSALATHELLHSARGVSSVVRCLNNIEEDVMLAAAQVAFVLLDACPPAQDEFLRLGGLASLSGCMHDYNVRLAQRCCSPFPQLCAVCGLVV